MTTAEHLAAAGIDPLLFSARELEYIRTEIEQLRNKDLVLPPSPQKALPDILYPNEFRQTLHQFLLPCLDALEKNALFVAFSKESREAAATPFLAFCDTLPRLLRTAESTLDNARIRHHLLEQTAEDHRAYIRRLICLEVATQIAHRPQLCQACREKTARIQQLISAAEQRIEEQAEIIASLSKLLEEKLPAFLDAGDPLLDGNASFNFTAYRNAALVLRQF